MKKVDYSYTGGLPLSQNVLNWQQDAFREVFGVLASMGFDVGAGDPVIITGCVVAGTTVSDGWIYDGSEVIYFEGGDTATAGTSMIKIQELKTSVVFQNGSNRDIYVDKKWVLDNTGVDDVTALKTFSYHLGNTNGGLMPGGNTLISPVGGTGNLAGVFTFFKTLFAPAMHMKGAVTVQAPAALANPPVYQDLGTLPAAWWPVADIHLKGFIEGYLLEIGGTLKFNDINMKIRTDGKVQAQFIKPDGAVGSYTVIVNALVPLS